MLQDDAHGLDLRRSASAGVPDSAQDALRSRCAMTDEALGVAHHAANLEAEGKELVPDCVQGGKGESARLELVPVSASSAAGAQPALVCKAQEVWPGDADAKDAPSRVASDCLHVAVARPGVVALEPTGDAAAPSSNAHSRSALERRLATLDARLQMLATQQHNHQAGEDGALFLPRRGEALQTNEAASFYGNPGSSAAGDSQLHSVQHQLDGVQQSGVLKGRARATAQAQQQREKPKKNGGERTGGLGLPDVVREILRDPAVLKWHQHREVYEVMDGERFERR